MGVIQNTINVFNCDHPILMGAVAKDYKQKMFFFVGDNRLLTYSFVATAAVMTSTCCKTTARIFNFLFYLLSN